MLNDAPRVVRMTIVGNATRSSVKVVNYASRVDNYTPREQARPHRKYYRLGWKVSIHFINRQVKWYVMPALLFMPPTCFAKVDFFANKYSLSHPLLSDIHGGKVCQRQAY
jgi:hypothetical protein